MNEKQIQGFRLQRVSLLIDESFNGNKSAFAKAWTARLRSLHELDEGKEMAASMVHRWFWENSPRPMGSRIARKIERAFSLPPSSLDQQTGPETDQQMIAELKTAYSPNLNDPDTRDIIEELGMMSAEERVAALQLFRTINSKSKKK